MEPDIDAEAARGRVDIPGSLLFHPLEVTMQTLIQLTITGVVLGLDPLAAGVVG